MVRWGGGQCGEVVSVAWWSVWGGGQCGEVVSVVMWSVW